MAEKGTFKQLMGMRGLVSDLIRTAGQEHASSSAGGGGSSSAEGSETSTVMEPESNAQEMVVLEEAQERLPEMEPIKYRVSANAANKRSDSFATLRRASTASFKGPRGKLTDEEVAGHRTRQAKEHVEQGEVKWDVYIEYAKSNNLFAVGVYLFALLAAQSASIGASSFFRVSRDALLTLSGCELQAARYG